MSTFTTSNTSTPLQPLYAGLFALLMLVATAVPAQAQMDDGELPSIDFAVNVAQHAQYLSLENADDPIAGFQRIRAGLNANVQFSENVSALVMLEQEPNDFGFQTVTPAVDFVILDVALNENLTFRTGSPVTGLMNFRGYSDGPAVQGNPLVGNSPADMITAGQGVKLIGAFDAFGFDLTINKGFGGALTTADGTSDTGFNYIGKVRFTGSDLVKVGAGVAFQSGNQGLVFATGDGDNYDAQVGTRATHAQLPNETILHADAKVTAGSADLDFWGGYATQSDVYAGDNSDYEALFFGVGAKLNLTDAFHLAGRYTYAGNQSDAVDNVNDAALDRIQLGLGTKVYDHAMFKLEYVYQNEGNTNLSGVGQNWQGVTTELSFNF